MAVPSRDGAMSAAPGDGGFEQAKQSVTLCAEVDKGVDEHVDKDLGAGTKAFFVMMVEGRISTCQSGLQRGGPIGKQRKSVEQEPQSYRAACSSPYQDIWARRYSTSARGLSKAILSSLLLFPPSAGPYHLSRCTHGRPTTWEMLPEGKARLVARGFTRRESLDYLNTLSPIPVPSSIRMIALSITGILTRRLGSLVSTGSFCAVARGL